MFAEPESFMVRFLRRDLNYGNQPSNVILKPTNRLIVKPEFNRSAVKVESDVKEENDVCIIPEDQFLEEKGPAKSLVAKQ